MVVAGEWKGDGPAAGCDDRKQVPGAGEAGHAGQDSGIGVAGGGGSRQRDGWIRGGEAEGAQVVDVGQFARFGGV